MKKKEIKENRNRTRTQAIDLLEEIKTIVFCFERDLAYARGWKKVQDKSGFRKWLYKIFHSGYLYKEPLNILYSYEKYKVLIKPYLSVLDKKYYKTVIIDDLLNYLCYEKAYTIDEAIKLYEEKKGRRI